MVAVKSRLKSLRAGFVLPMSLVATFITLMIVGASATYCTTQFRTSQEYLARTRCRLAAQSAIELVKGELHRAAIGGQAEETDRPGESGEASIDLSSAVGSIKEKTKRDEFLKMIPGYGPDLKICVDIKTKGGINCIYATAAQKHGGRSTSVTLQENVRIPVLSSDIFMYAYFSNRDGHLVSKYLTVNGDVRSNRDFYLSGANINGYIYASNTVHLADSESNLKTWFDGRYVTVRTQKSYNRNIRNDSHAKARPTNPLTSGQAWACGYEGANENRSGGILTRIISLLKDLTVALDVRYDDGEIPLTSESIVYNTKDKVYSEHTQRKVVQEKAGVIKMPRIVGDWEPETETDKHLQFYKDFAATARTPKGETGGSLSCSNSWVQADGANVQLAARVKLLTKKTVHHSGGTTIVHHGAETTTVHHDEEEITIHHDTKVVKHAAWDETKTAAEQIPSDGIPVYEHMRWRELALLGLLDRIDSKEYVKLEDGYVNGGQLFTTEQFEQVAGRNYQQIGSEAAIYEYGQNGWDHVQAGGLQDLTQQFYYRPNHPIGYVKLEITLIDPNESRWKVTYVYTSFDREETEDWDLTQEKLIVSRSIPLYQCKTSRKITEALTWPKAGDNHNSSGWLFLDSDLDAFTGTLLRPLPYGIDEGEVTSLIKAHFKSSGWGTGAMYYRATLSPDQYVVIEVWRVYKDGQAKMEVRHSIGKKNDDRNNGNTDYGDESRVPSDTGDDYYLPVYRWKANLDWHDNKNDWEDRWSGLLNDWRDGGYKKTITVKTGDRQYTYDGVFAAKTLTDKAAAAHSAHAGLDNVKVINGAVNDGWAKVSTGWRSKYPSGYLKIHVNQNYHADFSMTPVSDITLHHPEWEETVNEPWDETVLREAYDEESTRDPWDEVIQIDPYDEETNMVEIVSRELRGVFVKGGYYIDSDADLVSPEDLKVVTAGDLIGKKTEDLRPFREDAAESNKKTQTAQPDKGAVILIGTWDHPIVIDGPVVFDSDVVIRGFVQGRGTIYSGRNIHIIGDINYKNPPFWPENGGAKPNTRNCDMLTLVSRGSIVIGNYLCDKMWIDTSNGLIFSNYINAEPITDATSRYANKWVETDYTRTDARYRKVVYDKMTNGFRDDSLKLYESVVGDYVFQSKWSDFDDSSLDEGASLTANGSSCVFSQHWDVNPSNFADTRFFTNTVYQSGVIEAYANSKNWTASERIGSSSRRFNTAFWDASAKRYTSDFWNYCRNKYAIKSNAYRPSVNYIQSINAVLYSSMGLYGVVGGSRTPCVINGALIANEEALLPFARNRRIFFSSFSEDLTMAINWDIRLSPKSGDAVANSEDDEAYHSTLGGILLDDYDPEYPKVLSWQEVPDSFNKEYHATP